MGIQISTGLVRAAGYADKLRRVLIAATRNEVDPREAIKVASYINQHLFKILRENNIEKSDVIRIRFDIDIIDGKILVDWNSLRIEVYKHKADYVAEEIESTLPEMPEITEEEVKAALEEKARPEEEGTVYYQRSGEEAVIPEEEKEYTPIGHKKEKESFISKIIKKLKGIFK